VIGEARLFRLFGKITLRIGHRDRQIDQAVLDADADFVDLGAHRRANKHGTRRNERSQ
jgi:hypothetical protein